MRKLNVKKLVYFIISIILMLSFIILISNNKKELTASVFKKTENKQITTIDNNHEVNINYPMFYNEETDNVILEYINNLNDINNKQSSPTSLQIDYKIYNIDNYKYLLFDIVSSVDDDMVYKSYLLDQDNNIASYDNIFDLDKLKNKIIDYSNKKYASTIVKKIEESDINNLNYLINNDELIIYFYELKTSSMSYVPFIKILKKNLKDILKVEYDIDKSYTFKTVKKDKYIALTFDDGPSDYTKYILDVLKEYNAHVTFFSLGNRMSTYSKILNREIEEGHLVASHTYSHKDLTSLSVSKMLEEINSTNIAFNKATGKKITLVRPPYGNYDKTVLSNVSYPLILWNIDTKDWSNRNAKKTSNIMLKKAFNGGIALMHDLYESNVEALKIALPELEARGYNFVTIEEMSNKFNVTLKKGNAYRYIE